MHVATAKKIGMKSLLFLLFSSLLWYGLHPLRIYKASCTLTTSFRILNNVASVYTSHFHTFSLVPMNSKLSGVLDVSTSNNCSLV